MIDPFKIDWLGGDTWREGKLLDGLLVVQVDRYDTRPDGLSDYRIRIFGHNMIMDVDGIRLGDFGEAIGEAVKRLNVLLAEVEYTPCTD